MSNQKLVEICKKEILSIENEIKQYVKSNVLDKNTLGYHSLFKNLKDRKELLEIYQYESGS